MRESINPVQALRIAFEDGATIHFILANFSRPDECPRILSGRWLSEEGQKSVWNIVIIERPPDGRGIARDLINAVLLELDSASGTILSRKYYRNILGLELQQAIKRELDILRGGCRVPSR